MTLLTHQIMLNVSWAKQREAKDFCGWLLKPFPARTLYHARKEQFKWNLKTLNGKKDSTPSKGYAHSSQKKYTKKWLFIKDSECCRGVSTAGSRPGGAMVHLEDAGGSGSVLSTGNSKAGPLKCPCLPEL